MTSNKNPLNRNNFRTYEYSACRQSMAWRAAAALGRLCRAPCLAATWRCTCMADERVETAEAFRQVGLLSYALVDTLRGHWLDAALGCSAACAGVSDLHFVRSAVADLLEAADGSVEVVAMGCFLRGTNTIHRASNMHTHAVTITRALLLRQNA